MKHPKPRFKHDCDTCTFLGRFKRFDLYVHTEEPKTVIARSSSIPDDYTSGLRFKDLDPALGTAYNRARKRRLI